MMLMVGSKTLHIFVWKTCGSKRRPASIFTASILKTTPFVD